MTMCKFESNSKKKMKAIWALLQQIVYTWKNGHTCHGLEIRHT